MAVECVEIRDAQTGSRARVLVGFGMNCFEFIVRDEAGEIDLLWAEECFADGDKRASSSGAPLLFPFPGRIPGTQLTWEGKSYELEAGDGRGNAIHGFVHNRPWRNIERADNRVVGEFQASVDAPDVLDRWPADFHLRVAYQLCGNRLSCHVEATNPDDHPLPCGFGSHPYFRLPLGGESADDCRIQLPVRRQWELIEMLPTGRITDVPRAEELQAGLAFGQMQFDDVFTDLLAGDERVVATIHDPSSKRGVSVSFSNSFRECVVYNPPHRQAVCIEPYTCVPGAIALDDPTSKGLMILQPGETWRASIDIALL
ncbi:MAG: aldose 1-epimerase [Pirellulaceae bacterium]|jgi:aldose 1-epimerase|nr:aldose 1-epimerase [Pirellulaceae bacterium]MDP7018025.1 aldose 1-epimerase [Pirellulaceae bacterium]